MKARMLLVVAALAMSVASTASARTATAAERADCLSKIQKRIDAIDSRMRLPYDGREGERLRDRRRQLEEARAKCRVRE